MEDKLHYIELFDCYEPLFTEKQKEYFKDYYYEDLSLSEMSENYQIIRNAIFKQIKEVCQKLKQYEEKLELLKKKKEIMKIVKENPEIKEKIERIL